MGDVTGRCDYNCSDYYKQQFNLCTNGMNCDSGDGKTKAGIRFRVVPCGTDPCAVKQLTAYSAWTNCSAACGGGTQSQSRSCQIIPLNKTTQPSGNYLKALLSITKPSIPESTMPETTALFTNRYDNPNHMF